MGFGVTTALRMCKPITWQQDLSASWWQRLLEACWIFKSSHQSWLFYGNLCYLFCCGSRNNHEQWYRSSGATCMLQSDNQKLDIDNKANWIKHYLESKSDYDAKCIYNCTRHRAGLEVHDIWMFFDSCSWLSRELLSLALGSRGPNCRHECNCLTWNGFEYQCELSRYAAWEVMAPEIRNKPVPLPILMRQICHFPIKISVYVAHDLELFPHEML